MEDSIIRAIARAKEVRKEYNPQTLIPFPFQKIFDANSDVELGYKNISGQGISGAIIFDSESNKYKILINSDEPIERQYFTTAHELGHYFLHKDILQENGSNKPLVDTMKSMNGNVMFRGAIFTEEDRKREREANNFAAELIMPEEKVREAWSDVSGKFSVEYYADIFSVSVSAMAIRMERLGLRTNRG